MKFLIISDVHATKKKPRNRTEENYWNEAVQPKLDFIWDTFMQEKCDYILSGGDWLDSPIVDDSVKTYFITRFLPHKLIMTLGQHEIDNRNLTDDCSISLLYHADITTILSERILKNRIIIDNIHIYGCGFEEEIPDIKRKSAYNILLIHRLVSKNDLWFGNVNYTSTKQLFKKTKFDLIVSGDNHASFTDNQKDKWVINTGSMMRKNSKQEDHFPCIYIFDTDTLIPKQILIPCKPFNEVMRIEQINEKKVLSADLKAFEEELNRKDYKPEFNFVADLNKAKEDKEDGVKEITDEALNHAKTN